MGLDPDNIGRRGDIWKFHVVNDAANRLAGITEYHMLLEYLNERIRYPGDPPRFFWKTFNLSKGVFEETGIDFDSNYWTKVG